jgi:pyruvate,water dikinase
MQYVEWFENLTKDSLSVAGGKGANLGEMTRLRLPVPPGFAITTRSFDTFLEQNKLKEKIQQLIDGTNVEDTQQLMNTSMRIKQLIINAEIPLDMRNAMLQAYKNLSFTYHAMRELLNPEAVKLISAGRDFALVAVRSSATAEDLPTASFAGQQATFLNVRGIQTFLESVKKCWASLYEPRAIFYRAKNNVHSSSISVLVQRMVNSDKSGVMFTVNPTTGETSIMIEATWGLGESLVSGAVEPDTYILSRDGMLIEKRIGRKERMKIRDMATDRTVDMPIAENRVMQQVLTQDELTRLVEYGVMLEAHYGNPQDVEFAIEKGKIYIVQTRAVTTHVKKEEAEKSLAEAERKEEGKEVLVSGVGSSPGVATGVVRIVHGMQDISKVQQGDILVTVMTTPDLVPVMAKSSAIVTDQGGMTCHASIVGREMGLPVVVGTQNATKVLRDGMRVTVDAYAGKVYGGEVSVSHEDVAASQASHAAKWEVEQPDEMKVEEEKELMKTASVTNASVTKVKVNLVFPERAREVAAFADGVGLLRIEHMITKAGVHPAKLIREGRGEEYIKILMDGIRPIAAAFAGKPVWVRTLDARSDEFRNLQGGEDEPHEDNPMLGWHGIRRSIDEPDLLRAEFEAIKRLHLEGHTNVHIMLPFVTSVSEFTRAREIAKEVGLSDNTKIGIMIETPAAVMTIGDFCKAGIDFISFGSNDLTQLVLGVDRNNAKIASSFSEMHPAVLKMIGYAIKVCKSFHVETSICGEGPSNIPELVDFLVDCGITSVSVELDALHRVRTRVMQKEKQMLMDAMRKNQ